MCVCLLSSLGFGVFFFVVVVVLFFFVCFFLGGGAGVPVFPGRH